MKIKSILIALFAIVSSVAFSQELKFQSFELKPVDMTAKVNPVLDLNNEACALIRVAIASEDVTFQGIIVGEPKYEGGEWLVYVPEGTHRIKVTRKGYLPITVDFEREIEQFRTYELRIETPNNKLNKLRTIIMPTVSIGYAPMSYGAMVGIVKKNGVFVRYKSNFESINNSFEVDANGKDESGTTRWFGAGQSYSRWALTAGYIRRLGEKFYLYGGLGYGDRSLYWQSESGEYAKVTPASYTGVEVDLGGMIRFGSVAIALGAQSNQFNFVEANVSFGLMF